MKQKSLTVLLIEDSADYAELVQDWLALSREETTFVLNWTDSLNAGLKRLSSGGIDIILLDLGLPDSDGESTFAKVKRQSPDCPVIVLSSSDSESLALQLIREGAEDYLVKNTCSSESLVRAIRYAFLRRSSQSGKLRPVEADESSRIIGVIGAKGGLGTTTIASGLAAELRLETNEDVLLADLDFDSGQVSFLTGVESKYSLLHAIENKTRLDRSLWEAMVAKDPLGLDIVSSPNLMGESDVDATEVSEVLGLVAPFYRWTVLDLGRPDSFSMQLLNRAHEVFVVTSTSLGALYQAKRLVAALMDKWKIDADRIRLVINFYEPRLFSGKELNSIFGIPVYATVASDAEEIQKSLLDKAPPSENSQIRKQITNLARKVAGLSEKRTKAGLGPLFPFANKLRKSNRSAS